MKRRALISLEAALGLPLFLTFCLILQIALATQEAKYLYHLAGEEVAREMELIIIAKGLIPWGDFQRPFNFELPDFMEDWLIEKVGEQIGAQALRLRQNELFLTKVPHRPFLARTFRGSKHARMRREDHYWTYDVSTSWGLGLYFETWEDRQIVPDFSLYPFELDSYEEASEAAQDQDSIWSSHNFIRGKYFREKYGANLPDNFPFLSTFKQGIATKIQSLDLTAPTYQNAANLAERLQMDIRQMANYQGQSNAYAGVEIRPEEIQRRILHYVIPENHDAWQWESLQAVREQANLFGVELLITQDAISYAHRSEP